MTVSSTRVLLADMKRPTDPQSRVPLSNRIRDDLVTIIKDRQLSPGTKLPTVREIAREYGVGIRTAARAFEMLRDEGMIVTRTNSGAFVAPIAEMAVDLEIVLCINPVFLDGHNWRGVEWLRGITHGVQRRHARLHSLTNGAEFRLQHYTKSRFGVLFFDHAYEADGFGVVAQEVIERDIPACVVMATGETNLPFVECNLDCGFEQATTHLLALGHRDIALLNLPMPTDSASVERSVAWGSRQGYLRAYSRAGLEPNPYLYVEALHSESYGPEDTVRALDILLSRSPRPTAILCNNDARALLVLSLLQARGMSVPGDMSVVGSDNCWESARSIPALTTVERYFAQQGEEAVNYIVNRLRGEKAVRPHVFPQLVVRASSGVPAV